MFPFAIATIVLLIIGLAILGAAQAAARRKELGAWAAAHGLRFIPDKFGDLEDLFPGMAVLRQGSARYGYNLIKGDWRGRGLLAFDYHYETYSTDSKGRRDTDHHYFSCVALESVVPLSDLSIRPENFFDKIGEFLGANDIDFESAEFSRRYHVKAADRKWAYDVLHARAIQLLLDRPPGQLQMAGSWTMQWSGDVYRTAQFEARANLLTDLLDMLPDYVTRERGAIAARTIS